MYDLLLKEYIVHYSKGSSSKQADGQAPGIVAAPKLSTWVILRMCPIFGRNTSRNDQVTCARYNSISTGAMQMV